jgi:uncharacterized protein (DUF1330 family)
MVGKSSVLNALDRDVLTIKLEPNHVNLMKNHFKLVFALIASAAFGGVPQGLHAQAGSPVYVIEEIDVSNLDSYLREYAVKSLALVNASGGRRLVIGNGKTTSIEGEPPKSRVVVLQWESMEKMQAWLNSQENKELRKIGDKYAKFRIFAVEGLPR